MGGNPAGFSKIDKGNYTMTVHHFNIEDAKKYGVDAAVILQNLRFWLEHNKANGTHINDGYVWTYNSARAFSELFPYWSGNKIQKLLKKLENDGVIITGNYNKAGYDKTKWYSLPEYSLQPNGGMESAKRIDGSSQSAQPIPDINTDVITDVINTDISSKRNVYFIDELCSDGFKHCHKAMKYIGQLKKSGFAVYDGSLSIEEWSDCENAMSSCDEFDHVGYFDWWANKYSNTFTKKAALTNMVCDMNRIEFDRFYDMKYLQEFE